MQWQTLLQQRMDEAVARQDTAGVNLLVLRDGKVIANLTSGMADREKGTPMAEDTIFRLYSMTKPVTACAAMILMERGIIDLYDWVEGYLPGFRSQRVVSANGTETAWRGVTIRDLLSMSSGLAYPDVDPAGQASARVFEEALDRLDGGNEMTTLELANKLGQQPLAFQPGKSFRYGTSADILGAVIEAASGKKFGDFLRDELFQPLGMKDTAFYIPEEKQHRRAMVYRKMPDGSLKHEPTTNLAISNRLTKDPAFQSGGAGLCSTLPDYARFAQMLMNGGQLDGVRILQPKTVEYLISPALDPLPQAELEKGWYTLSGYSYGNLMRICKDPSRSGSMTTLGEYGWDGWLGTYFSNHPTEKLTILMGQQKCDAGTTELTRKLRNIILTHID